jgi:hypothetical protein
MESTLTVLLHIFILYLFGFNEHLLSITHTLALFTVEGVIKLITGLMKYLQYNSLPV